MGKFIPRLIQRVHFLMTANSWSLNATRHSSLLGSPRLTTGCKLGEITTFPVQMILRSEDISEAINPHCLHTAWHSDAYLGHSDAQEQ